LLQCVAVKKSLQICQPSGDGIRFVRVPIHWVYHLEFCQTMIRLHQQQLFPKEFSLNFFRSLL
jgi:hypothetical protein